MATLPDRRLRMRTRADLRHVSGWVWLLLVLAAVQLLLGVAVDSDRELVSWLLLPLSAAGLVIAAALVHVGRRHQLLLLAAICYAIPGVVEIVASYFRGPGWLLPAWVTQGDYADLANKVEGLTNLVGGWLWILQIVAVFAIALHLGRVGTSRGWLIVGIGIALALLQAGVAIQSIMAFADAQLDATWQLAISGVLAPLATVGSAYLAAVALEQRRPLFLAASVGGLIATGSALLQGLVGDASSGIGYAVLVVFALISAFATLALLLAILLELPTDAVASASEAPANPTQELHSPAQ